MELSIVSYQQLTSGQSAAASQLQRALLATGIVGVSGVPDFAERSLQYVQAARVFAALPETTKQRYAPDRDQGETEGYELGAEYFKNEHGDWQIDDKKASYYAYVPDDNRNRWPYEVDLRSAYLALGDVIFNTGKVLLNMLGLNESKGLHLNRMSGYGRLLHYHKEDEATNANPDWCGAHFDHDVFTGLMPAYYFMNGQPVDEPEEAGLYISVDQSDQYHKVYIPDSSIMLFQVGELGQLISNDQIRATRHLVRKAKAGIERYTFALFYSPAEDYVIRSQSTLTDDARYANGRKDDGSLPYLVWREASFARYRAVK